MICEECKRCFNYLVCEIGCFGSSKPCEHLTQDSQNDEWVMPIDWINPYEE